MSVEAVKAHIVGRAAGRGWPGLSPLRWLLLVLCVMVLHGVALQQWQPAAVPRAAQVPGPGLRTRVLVAPPAVPPPQLTERIPAAVPLPPQPGARRDPDRQAATPVQMPSPQPVTALPADPAAPTPEPAGNTELPVYPTRLPPPLQWTYTVQRAGGGGTAVLRWQPEGERYQARLEASVAGAPAFDWSSAGLIDGAGVAPVRFVDRRRGRGAQAANFQRETGRITYSGPPVEQPLPPGAQDRLSWWLQLAGIVAAEPARWQAGRRIEVFVSGARGDAEVWTFTVIGTEPVASPDTSIPWLKLLREPSRPYDTRAEVWLDPARHHMPARLRLTNGDAFTELSLAEAP
jgi:hypothetical protein